MCECDCRFLDSFIFYHLFLCKSDFLPHYLFYALSVIFMIILTNISSAFFSHSHSSFSQNDFSCNSFQCCCFAFMPRTRPLSAQRFSYSIIYSIHGAKSKGMNSLFSIPSTVHPTIRNCNISISTANFRLLWGIYDSFIYTLYFIYHLTRIRLTPTCDTVKQYKYSCKVNVIVDFPIILNDYKMSKYRNIGIDGRSVHCCTAQFEYPIFTLT